MEAISDFGLTAAAKVKGLDPGKGGGRQSNPWSPWREEFDVEYTAEP